MVTHQHLQELIYGKSIKTTQEYGYTAWSSVYRANFHSGIDYALGGYPELRSVCDGIVYIDDVYNKTKGHGVCVGVLTQTPLGEIIFLYGHLYENYVTHGQIVKKGDVIGLEGNTGFSTGNHLHFELRLGTTNPYLETSDEEYLKRFDDPRNIDKYLQGEMTEINKLKKQISELQEALASAYINNDNTNYYKSLLTEEVISDELRNPNKVGIMNELYQELLGRDVDEIGKEYWKNRSVLDIFRGIRTSKEKKYNDLNQIYNILLDRDIDQSGLEYWSKFSDLSEVVKEIKSSDEFKEVNCKNDPRENNKINKNSTNSSSKNNFELAVTSKGL